MFPPVTYDLVCLGGAGNIKTLGDSYQFTVDMQDFSPEDVIVTTSNNQIEVHAEKVGSLLSDLKWHGPTASHDRTPTQLSVVSKIGVEK